MALPHKFSFFPKQVLLNQTEGAFFVILDNLSALIAGLLAIWAIVILLDNIATAEFLTLGASFILLSNLFTADSFALGARFILI